MDNDKEIYLSKLQFVNGLIFLGTFIVSLFLSYDSIKKYEGKNILNKEKFAKIYNMNRKIVTIILFVYLYINYKQYKNVNKSGEEKKILRDELVASIITFVAGLIVLYDSYLNLNTLYDISDNPEI